MGMDTALYYTFSTIAQTLAGGIALLGAFVLYRFQMLAGSIEDTSEYVRKEFKSKSHELHNKIDQAKFDREYDLVHELSKSYSEGEIDPPTIQKYYSARSRLGSMLSHRKILFRYFKFSLIATVLLILASALVLIFTPRLYMKSCSVTVIFAVGAIWFAVCLISFVKVLLKALGEA